MSHLQTSIDLFTEVAHSQEEKGIQKYGQQLDPLDSNYDWLQMALEEQVDGTKYLIAEMEKRKHVVQKIREIIKYRVNNFSNKEIEQWLDVLEGKA